MLIEAGKEEHLLRMSVTSLIEFNLTSNGRGLRRGSEYLP